MKKHLLLIFILISINISYSQVGNSPYPIIFVHGIISSDQTWENLVSLLDNSFSISGNYKFNAILNARGDDTTNYLYDVMIPSYDTNGNLVNRLTNSNIYLINFRNFWNRDVDNPRIIIHSDNTPGSNQSASNQSAIYKQGYALKICIDSVLKVTGASKVILVGHSMGGLAIREYLQRIENYSHKWWINPNETDGHKVAKVVTIGSPHLGTNATTFNPPFIIDIDNKSESVRDLRYSYFTVTTAPFLFSNDESNIPHLYPYLYYNKDVNCNGFENDWIDGLSNGTNYNLALPLPQNILYTWIIAEYIGLGSDGAVDIDRQWIHENGTPTPIGISDTLFTNKNHLQETSDYESILRGLDEPDDMTFAYPLEFNKTYSGFITTQMYGNVLDYDYYKVNALENGYLTVSIDGNNAGLSGLELLSNTGSVISSIPITSSGLMSNLVTSGDYFIRVRGFGDQNTNFNSYRLISYFDEQVTYYGIESKPTGGNWNDSNTWVGNVIPTTNDNVIINGIVNVTDGAICNNIVIKDTLQNLQDCQRIERTLTIRGDIINNGLIRDMLSSSCEYYNDRIRLDIEGNLVNNGIWQPWHTRLIGNVTQHLSVASGKNFGGFFTNMDTLRPILPLTNLTFSTTFNLNNGKLLMGNKSIYSGALINGTIDSGNIYNGYFENMNCTGINTFINTNLSINVTINENTKFYGGILNRNVYCLADVEILNTVDIGESSFINGLLTVTDTLQNSHHFCTYSSYTLTVNGNIINNGVIRNKPGFTCSLMLDIKGDIINNGIWILNHTRLIGNVTQHLSVASGKNFGGFFTNLDTLRPIIPLTNLTFSTTFNLNNGKLLMGNKSMYIVTIYNGKIDSGSIFNGTLENISCTGSSILHNTLLNNVKIDEANFHGVVTIINATINNLLTVTDTLQNFQYCQGIERTLTIKGDVINNGLIRDLVNSGCGYYNDRIRLDIEGNIVNNGVWQPGHTRLFYNYSSEKTISLKNTTSSNITIDSSNITGTDAGSFTITSGGGNVVVAPGATHVLKVMFNGGGNFLRNANLNIFCNQIGSLNNISLQGTGAGQSLSLNLEAFLEGFYSPGSTSDNIFNSKVISDIKSIKNEVEGSKNNIKYDNNYSDNLLNNVQDSIAVYLAQSSSPFTIVDSTKSILSDSGMANCNFSNVSNGNYFIIIRHRNHIETWSSTAVTFTSESNVNYDFTSSQSQALGNNLVQIGNEWCLYSGDVNQDGLIELTDVLFIYNDVSNFSSGYLVTDINGDNYTDLTDLLIAFNNSVKFIAKITP